MHNLFQRYLSYVLVFWLFLGSFRGYLALFEEGCTEPRQIYPCQTATLPPVDQLSLERGIPVRSEKELAHLLEDFLS